MGRYRYDGEERHPACRCGCGELADECPRGSNPLGSMTITRPDPNPYAKEDERE